MQLLVLEASEYIINILDNIQKPETYVTNDNKYLLWSDSLDEILLFLKIDDINNNTFLLNKPNKFIIDNNTFIPIQDTKINYNILKFPDIPEKITKYFYNNNKIYILFTDILKLLIVFDITTYNYEYFYELNIEDRLIFNYNILFNDNNIHYLYCNSMYKVYVFEININSNNTKNNLDNILQNNNTTVNNIQQSIFLNNNHHHQINIDNSKILTTTFLYNIVDVLLYDLHIHNTISVYKKKYYLEIFLFNRKTKLYTFINYNLNRKKIETKCSKIIIFDKLATYDDYKILNIKYCINNINNILLILYSLDIIIINKITKDYKIIYLDNIINTIIHNNNISILQYETIIKKITHNSDLFYKYENLIASYPIIRNAYINNNNWYIKNYNGFISFFNNNIIENIKNQTNYYIDNKNNIIYLNFNNYTIEIINILTNMNNINLDNINQYIKKNINDKLKPFINNININTDIKYNILKYIYLYNYV